MTNNYNAIAGFYATLSRAVYGNHLIRAQQTLLKYLQAGDKILLVGGGNGEILQYMEALKIPLEVVYVEASDKMMQIAQRPVFAYLNVRFICDRIENLTLENDFQIVFTPFLLDNFEAKKLEEIISQLYGSLIVQGHWLYADFSVKKDQSPFWQKALLKLMYVFFRYTCHIETQKLIDPRPHFEARQMNCLSEKYFLRRFIVAGCYRKN